MLKKVQQILGVKSSKNVLLDMEPEISVGKKKKNETKMDIPGNLPVENFYQILMHLSSADMLNAWRCCRRWRHRIEGSWRMKCILDGYFECEDDLESEFYRKFVSKYSKWEGIYTYNRMLKNNWIKNNFKEIRLDCAIEKIQIYKPLVYFGGDIIVITCTNSKHRVLDCTTGCVKFEFLLPDPEHNKISEVGKFENRLIVISDRTLHGGTIIHITIWNIETGDFIQEFQMEIERKAETKILFYKDLLVTVISKLYTANVINITQKKVDYCRDDIRSICQCDDKIAMGTNVGTILIINLDYTELMILNCNDPDRSIDDIQMKDNYLVGFSQIEDEETLNKAYIFNIKTKTKLYEVERLWKYGFRMYVNKNILVYPSSQHKVFRPTLKHCHLDSGNCIHKKDKNCVTWFANDFFILEEYRLCGLSNLLSINSGKRIGCLKFPDYPEYPIYSEEIWKTKSKIAYYACDLATSIIYLKILNFEAPIKT